MITLTDIQKHGVITNGGRIEERVYTYAELPHIHTDPAGREVDIGPALCRSYDVAYMRPHCEDIPECRGVSFKNFLRLHYDGTLYVGTTLHVNEYEPRLYDEQADALAPEDYRCPVCGASLWLSDESLPARRAQQRYGELMFAEGVPLLDAHVYAPIDTEGFFGRTYCAHCLHEGRWTVTGVYATRFADMGYVDASYEGEIDHIYAEMVNREATHAIEAVKYVCNEICSRYTARAKKPFWFLTSEGRDARHDIKYFTKSFDNDIKQMRKKAEYLLGNDNQAGELGNVVRIVTPYRAFMQNGLYTDDVKSFVRPYINMRGHIRTPREKEIRADDSEKLDDYKLAWAKYQESLSSSLS